MKRKKGAKNKHKGSGSTLGPRIDQLPVRSLRDS
jgi:hypothetical protein